MLLQELVSTSAQVAAATQRRAKIEALARCLKRLPPNEIAIAVAYLCGEVAQSALGVGWASLAALPGIAAPAATIQIGDLDRALGRIQASRGAGSQAARHGQLAALFAMLTEPEQRFVTGVLSGGLRQGALGGVMAEAVARAGEVPASEVRRALLVSGDLGAVAVAALTGGAAALSSFHLSLLRPVSPMLAHSAANAQAALERISPAAVEWKFDGVRVQVHRRGREVALFTRNLADATDRAPELVQTITSLPGGDFILDGELIALGRMGRPRAFQETMGRFGSRPLDRPGPRAASPRASLGLSPFFFDCLHLAGQDLLERPEAERFAALATALPAELLVPRIVTNEPQRAEAFLDAALESGHEGIMLKALDAPYEAGRRGSGWLKVKRPLSLDLVVLAAEWGHGRRQGWLSNLHLGARDAASGRFVMVGKTFKGMTDAMLTWQTEHLLTLESTRDAHTVHVRPELVVEIAFDGVQQSSRYPGGVALRFARVKGYRLDKAPEEADRIDSLQAFLGKET